jgi:hypothetical protein
METNRVIKVTPSARGRLFIEMADGRTGIFDTRPYLVSDYFRELEDETYFRQVRLFFRGVGWPNGQDFGPDTIATELQTHIEAA